MPALVKRSVGSFAGNRGDDGTRLWPRCSKYFRKVSRTSFPVIINNVSSSLSARLTARTRNGLLTKIEFSTHLKVRRNDDFSLYSTSSRSGLDTARTFSRTKSKGKP